MGNAPSMMIDPNGESFGQAPMITEISAGEAGVGWETSGSSLWNKVGRGDNSSSGSFDWIDQLTKGASGGGGDWDFSGFIGNIAMAQIMGSFNLAMNGDCVKYSFSVPLGSAGGGGNAEEPSYGFIGPVQPGDEDQQQNEDQLGSKPLPKGLGPYVSSNPLLTSNGENTYTWEEFVTYNQGLSYEEIVNQRSESSGASGGPELRYVVNPIDFKVMDMRHVLVVGYHYGLLVGHTVEIAQFFSQSTRPSSFNRQDYYSNQIGYDFYHFSRTPHASQYKGFINKMNDFMLHHQISRHLKKD